MIVAAKRAGSSYEERTCMRCFEGVCMTCSVVRAWHASGALAVGGWSTSTLSRIIHEAELR